MAVDMFMKIDDIKGESVDKTHKDEIQVLAWSWGMSQSGTTHAGPGGGAGKVNVQDLSFTKYIDTSSPNLIKMCCNGKHFKQALLTVRKAGEHPLEYLKIKLLDVLISNVSTGGSGGEDRLTENVTLNFGKFEVIYTPQTATGAGGAAIPVTWNIPANTDSIA
ncbi:MAG TPA: type VI secretion system tube protein Hcp [Polyangia bacterium]|jgi:type VI secretion system secreted protein Hcp|nr:type VI secretion system tube protein Hcp [Polyangia bacterium]